MSKVFVLDTNKQALNPVHAGRARLLLKAGKAAVYRRYPFTIMLKRAVDHPMLQPLRVKGFQSGDLVRAVVTGGTKQGTYMGKVAVRTSGSFNITTRDGTTQGISHRCCVLVARSDGYTYVQGKERALPPTA